THLGTFTVGSAGQYRLTVHNAGSTESPGPLVLTDTLPDGLIFAAATGTGWTCTGSSGTAVSCSHPAALAVDASTELVLTVDVLPAAFDPVSRQIQNTATVTGTGSPPASATDTAPVRAVPALRISKKLLSYADDVATYRITVANLGPTATDGTVTVTDRLPTGLRLRTVSGADWHCDSTVICVRSTPLPAGRSSTVTLTATVTAPAGGTITNVASVTGAGTSGPATSSAVLAVSANGGSGSGSGSGGLAQTGRDTRYPLELALGLVMVGFGLLLLARRRRRQG
ncbi:MAG TPA: LPXTG cell wall anchor domain-containing protein, partial [Jatrophihabitans sp.]|nr:LPXTG cell wall anchor domain-containing protein [Jatrophihabitans sp.]